VSCETHSIFLVPAPSTRRFADTLPIRDDSSPASRTTPQMLAAGIPYGDVPPAELLAEVAEASSDRMVASDSDLLAAALPCLIWPCQTCCP